MCISKQSYKSHVPKMQEDWASPCPGFLANTVSSGHMKRWWVLASWGTVTTATVSGKVKSVWELVRLVNGWNCLLWADPKITLRITKLGISYDLPRHSISHSPGAHLCAGLGFLSLFLPGHTLASISLWVTQQILMRSTILLTGVLSISVSRWSLSVHNFKLCMF